LLEAKGGGHGALIARFDFLQVGLFGGAVLRFMPVYPWFQALDSMNVAALRENCQKLLQRYGPVGFLKIEC
jgi:hypothetical protein